MVERPVAVGVKRVADVAGAAIGGLVSLPVMAVAALVVRIRVGTPILFRQLRPGLHTQLFTLYKFRTMTVDVDVDGALLPDRDRLTRTGSLLRRWSVDELPELWNVAKGDMSLVGPRPLLVEYLDIYNTEQMRRHDMRPGLTGLAQISGRNDQTWEERLALDVWYVDHWSLWLDARIIALTIAKVVSGEGVSSSGHATMEPFEGSQHG